MKFIFALALVVFSASLAAQVQPQSDKAIYSLKYQKFKGMKTGGIVMIVAGGICTVAGIASVANSSSTYTSTTYPQGSDYQPGTAGVLLLSGGISLIGGGITLAIIGNKKMKFYKQKMDGVSLNFNFKPQQPGLVLTYKF